MSLKTRVNALEQQNAGGERPCLVLREDMRDQALYRDRHGNEYRRGENWPDENRYQLIVIRYELVGGGELPADGNISMLPANW